MPDYINPIPPPNDPGDIAQAAFDRIRLTFPNYDPREPQMATMVLVALAFRAAEIADLVPLIPKSIFRWFGANVIGFPPDDGSPARGAVTIFVRDDAGYVIEADTTVAIEDDLGETHLFGLDADAIVPSGSTSVSNVTVTALDDGDEANGITGGLTSLAEDLDYVISVTQQGTTNGGADAEADNDYVNRLSRRLGLIPRPVFAEDFAALAMVEFPEIWRMAGLNHYGPGVNQVNRLNIIGTGGTYTLTLAGQTTGALAWNATPSQVQTALEALSSADPGDVVVTDSGLGYYRVEHLGAFTYATRVFTITSSTTGGTHTVTLDTAAVAPNPSLAGVVSVAGQYEDGTALSSDLKAAVDLLLQANREWGFIVNVVDFTYHDVDATFTFTTLSNYNKTDVEARAEQAVADYVNPATFAALPKDPRGLKLQSIIYHWEVIGILQAVEGLDRLITLTIGLDGGAQTAADKTMAGDFPLPQPGNIIGTAS